ncbi:MAG: mRNA surveillance protein pelota [archaeon]|nr:mRNA surveillance protein pelota [archaeon]
MEHFIVAMKILKTARKEGFVEVVPDSFDDLWHLEKIIEPGDLVSGSSERKIKATQEGEKAFKQKVFVELEVKKCEFHEATNQLRVIGTVVFAKPEELVELKSHHTIEVEPGTPIKITKKELKNYHIERLERAKASAGRQRLLLVVMDDEEAELAFLRDVGIESKARILAKKSGKRFKETEKGNKYFDELLEKIKELSPQKLVIAGPGFEKQNFEKFLSQKHENLKAVFESTNSVGITGLNELIKGGKIDRLLEGLHSAEEARTVEKILMGIGQSQSAIGFMEVTKAVGANAAQEIAVNEKMLSEKRRETEELLDSAERIGTKIVFVSAQSDAGKKLEGLGGVAAYLRYKMR